MEFFDSSTADFPLLILFFGVILFIAISDFLEYKRKKDKEKK